MRKPGRAVFAALLALAAVAAQSGVARAGDNTIRQPGDHPNYPVEIEPHLLFAWDYVGFAGAGYDALGIGLGARFSIPIVKNGFIPTINDTVAIGFGADYTYFGCPNGCGVSTLTFPVVLQWNFYVAQRFSVFGEPGFSLNYNFFPSAFCGGIKVGCGNALYPDIVFEVGGRYHINEHLALTGRVGFPDVTFGLSFM
jgi:hypothetical protein